MNQSYALVVLGMHRSGTSALTGSLGILGVDLGHEMRAPHEGVNAKGYWEHLGILRVHEQLLDHLRSSWDDVRPLPANWWKDPAIRPFRDEIVRILRRDFGNARMWGVKDPRTCRLVPLWLDVFDELGCRYGFVHMMRSPVEVARSLAKRDQFDDDKSTLLWLENNLAAERATRGRTRVFLGFDDLLASPHATLRRIETELGMSFPVAIEERSDALREFLVPQLKHHAASSVDSLHCSELSSHLATRVRSALEASMGGESGRAREEWDGAFDEYAELVASLEPVRGHLDDLQQRVTSLKSRIVQIESSASWRFTRPFRKGARFVTRLFSRNGSRNASPVARTS